jgi:hypothetical protein
MGPPPGGIPATALIYEPAGLWSQVVFIAWPSRCNWRQAVTRNYFNSGIWKPALVRAGVEPTRANGTHAQRHHYASVLLDAGESIRAVSEYLGRTDPGSPCGSTPASCPPAPSAPATPSTEPVSLSTERTGPNPSDRYGEMAVRRELPRATRAGRAGCRPSWMW